MNQRFGPHAFYVHLTRDREATARSLARRFSANGNMITAYRDAIMCQPVNSDPMSVCLDNVDTVNSNIEAYLSDKSHVMRVQLETVQKDFCRFWNWIGAEGDLEAGLAEWSIRHNASLGLNDAA